MIGYIYVLTNTINGKQYVGQTTLTVERRWIEHQRRARKGHQECSALYPVIKSHGPDVFHVQTYERVDGVQADLDAAERAVIVALNTRVPHGYNLTTGGFGGGPLHQETKDKLRAINKGRVRSISEREKTGAALRGRTRPRDVVEKVRLANLGKKRSPDYCAAASARMRGRTVSAAARVKISAAQKGRTITWGAKISASKQGRPSRPPGFHHSEETKAKIRATNKATWQRKHGLAT